MLRNTQNVASRDKNGLYLQVSRKGKRKQTTIHPHLKMLAFLAASEASLFGVNADETDKLYRAEKEPDSTEMPDWQPVKTIRSKRITNPQAMLAEAFDKMELELLTENELEYDRQTVAELTGF